jgi:SAM-dependent methyltransferase
MGAAEFTVPRLARLYDQVCTPRADIAFYTALAGNTPLSVLDLCCGTGHLATELAARGHDVTGVDAAAAMLAVARERPGGDQVTWVEADARTVALTGPFDLVVLTGHAFQAFLTDEDVHAMLCTVRDALAPGGRLAFETRNPLVREWEQWTPAGSRGRVSIDGEGEVEVWTSLRRVDDTFVEFVMHYRFLATGEELVSPQTIRFSTRADVERQLTAAGLTPEIWYGDWDASPCTEQSPEIIVIAR